MTIRRPTALLAVTLIACVTPSKRHAITSVSSQAPAAPTPPPPPPPPPPLSDDTASPYFGPEVSDLREEAHDVLQQQSELAWKNWVQGDDVDLASTYRGHDELFSPESITTVRRARAAAKDAAARALRNFELYLAGEAIAKDTAQLSDEVLNVEAGETVTVGDVKYSYRELDKAMAAEAVAAKRAKIYDAETSILAKLNPLLLQKQEKTEAALKKLGYLSYADLAAELRDVNLDSLAKLAEQTLRQTDGLYSDAMNKLAMDELAIPLAKLRRSDIPRLFRGVSDDAAFPASNLVSSARSLFLGLGFDITQQHGLTIDTADAARKNPRALCIPIEVPTDVRVSVKPRGGAEEYRSFFHELSHAEHYLNTTRTEWEFQQLGNNAVGEAYGFLLEGVVDNPAWLQTATPLKGDALTKFVRHGALRRLYMLRRYAAKVLFQVQWRSGQLKDPPAEAYGKLLSRAYGFPLTAADSQRYLVDDDDFFYSADYLRAWLLAAQLDRYLTSSYGARWWESIDAGDFLRSLWAEGTRPTADEVAKHLGVSGVEPAAMVKLLAERLKQ